MARDARICIAETPEKEKPNSKNTTTDEEATEQDTTTSQED